MSRQGKHAYTSLVCNSCSKSFERQTRRAKRTSRPLCTSCLRSTISKISFWPTTLLKEVIGNEGVTNNGTDYEHKLDDLKEELWERQAKQHEQLIAKGNNAKDKGELK